MFNFGIDLVTIKVTTTADSTDATAFVIFTHPRTGEITGEVWYYRTPEGDWNLHRAVWSQGWRERLAVGYREVVGGWLAA